LERSRFDQNLVALSGNVAYIVLFDRDCHPLAVTMIDAGDLPLVAGYKWHLSNGKYAGAHVNGRLIQMHRLITGWSVKECPQIDHENTDGLDNRRVNLRQATSSQNHVNMPRRADNTSGYIGVSWSRITSKWKAELSFQGVRYCLGYFLSATEAALAYDRKKLELCGEFAKLNFPLQP
jgi:hypothetical protein